MEPEKEKLICLGENMDPNAAIRFLSTPPASIELTKLKEIGPKELVPLTTQKSSPPPIRKDSPGIEKVCQQLEKYALHFNPHLLTDYNCLQEKHALIMQGGISDKKYVIAVLSPNSTHIHYFGLQVEESGLALSPMLKVESNMIQYESTEKITFSHDPKALMNRKSTHCPEGQVTQQETLLQIVATAYFGTCYQEQERRRAGYEDAYQMNWDCVYTKEDAVTPISNNIKG